jgi:hypothetical protein
MPAQRWRLTFARAADSPDAPQRDQATVWEPLLDALAVPAERARLIPGAPLPVGMSADRELVDLLVPRRWTIGPLRDEIDAATPPDHRLLDLHDVWLGEASLPSLVVAGDYRVTLAPPAGEGTVVSRADLDAAIRATLSASNVARTRQKGGRSVVDNLRPLIVDIRTIDAGCLWMRLRFDPALGTGRPEDVVDALAAALGRPLTIGRRHRERLWLRGETDA